MSQFVEIYSHNSGIRDMYVVSPDRSRYMGVHSKVSPILAYVLILSTCRCHTYMPAKLLDPIRPNTIPM